MDAWFAATSILAQATAPGSASPAPSGGSTLMLSLRRWYSSLTLSSPDAISGLAWLWAILLGLAGLTLLAMLFQGPFRTLRQLLDIAGHVRLFSAAMDRIRRSGRLLAIVIGMTVVTWTTHQMLTYADPQGREDLLLLLKGRHSVQLAIEQGALAAATPLRDIVGLGNFVPMLIGAAILTFQYSSDRWGSVSRVISARATRDAVWGTVSWGAAALYAVYRTIGMIYGSFDLPLGGCLGLEIGLEVLVVPILMPLADGLLLAWVAVELRNAGLSETAENGSIDVAGTVALMPAAAVACVLMMLGRYVATLTALLSPYVNMTSAANYMRWQLGWGVVDMQAAGLMAVGLAAPLAWCRGTVRSLFEGYGRLLRQEGGRLVGLLIGTGAMGAAMSAVAYVLVLSLPTQSWVLSAADAYAHYATLSIGLLTLAGLVELGERSLPAASSASSPIQVDPASDVV